MTLLASEIRSYVKKGYEITIALSTEERLENIRDFASRQGFEEKIKFVRGTLSSGMDFPDEKRCLIAENDIFKYSRKPKHRKGSGNPGTEDTIFYRSAHRRLCGPENHGIGKFIGIQQLKVQGETKDYIKIKYAGR